MKPGDKYNHFKGTIVEIVAIALHSETMEEMKKLQDEGLVKSIGVSNFTINHLKDAFETGVVFLSDGWGAGGRDSHADQLRDILAGCGCGVSGRGHGAPGGGRAELAPRGRGECLQHDDRCSGWPVGGPVPRRRLGGRYPGAHSDHRVSGGLCRA